MKKEELYPEHLGDFSGSLEKHHLDPQLEKRHIHSDLEDERDISSLKFQKLAEDVHYQLVKSSTHPKIRSIIGGGKDKKRIIVISEILKTKF